MTTTSTTADAPATLPAAPPPSRSTPTPFRVCVRGYEPAHLPFDDQYAAAAYARALDPAAFRVTSPDVEVSASTGRALVRCAAKGCRRAHVRKFTTETTLMAWNGRPHHSTAVVIAGVRTAYRDRYHFARLLVGGFECTGCGGDRATAEVIQGTVVEGITCGARCRNAVGPSCDCQCGGDNHASDHTEI